VANYKLITHLGETVMNCYRLRYFVEKDRIFWSFPNRAGKAKKPYRSTLICFL